MFVVCLLFGVMCVCCWFVVDVCVLVVCFLFVRCSLFVVVVCLWSRVCCVRLPVCFVCLCLLVGRLVGWLVVVVAVACGVCCLLFVVW